LLWSCSIHTGCDRQLSPGVSGQPTVVMPYETTTVVQEPGGGRRGSRPSARSSPRCVSPLRDHVRGDDPLEAGDVSGWTCPVESPPDRSSVDTFWTHKAPKLGVIGRNCK